MIKPVCDICKEELDEFGAILLGPPNKKNMVVKFHICKKHYKKIIKKFKIKQYEKATKKNK